MRVYLDHNACTPVDPRVLECFLAIERENPANPGSVHGSGRRSRAVLERARAEIAVALAVPEDTVVLVSGGSEANNLAVLGLGDPALPVLLAPLEHPSVLEPALARGVVWWSVSSDGRARVEHPGRAAGVVCLVHAQNEIGTLQPVEAASAVARALGAPLHVDAAQTLGRVPLDEPLRLADSCALSVHKAGGLRGASVLVVRDPQRLRPLLRGGGQERGLRPGTQSPALAAATALAIQLAVAEQATRAAAMARALSAFEAALEGRVRARRLTSGSCLPNTAMYRFDGVDGRVLLPALDLAGVEASSGSACSSGSSQPPRVLAAMGLGDADARACLRFSVDWRCATVDAIRAGRIVADVVARLQSTPSCA